MFGFLRNNIHESSEDRRYYHKQYDNKLREIETSFDQLKKTTSSVIQQASTVTELLNRNIELFEKRFNTIANTIENIIVIKTINRQWISVNDFTCTLLGINKEVCIGKSNHQIIEIYPQLETIINLLDKAETNSWNTKRSEKLSITIHDSAYDIVIKPIETTDKKANELVLIGKKVK